MATNREELIREAMEDHSCPATARSAAEMAAETWDDFHTPPMTTEEYHGWLREQDLSWGEDVPNAGLKEYARDSGWIIGLVLTAIFQLFTLPFRR